jgi:hypothetical protein
MDETTTSAPAPAVASAEPAAPAPTAAPEQPTALPSLSETIARANAAGAKAAAEAKAKDAAPVPEPPKPAVAVADGVVPEPPAQTAPAAEPEAKPDPMAALVARFEAMEKQNASLMEQLAKLTAKPAEAPKPEPEKPAAKPTEKRLTDSPYEAQALLYFGEDLPAPLMSEATDVLSKRGGWQSELRAAEAAVAAGDATAKERVAKAQSAIAKAQAQLARIEHDASIARAVASSQKPAAQAWGVTAREEYVDGVLAIPIEERKDWGDVASLADHEIAAVMRAVPAGTNLDDYEKRASQALIVYAASKKAPAAATAMADVQPAKTVAAPKNPAPLAPPKVETPTAGPAWPNDKILSLHEIQQQSNARARGDRTN